MDVGGLMEKRCHVEEVPNLGIPRKQCRTCGRFPIVKDIRTPEQKAADEARWAKNEQEIAELEAYIEHLERKIALKAEMRARMFEVLGIAPPEISS